MLIDAHHHLWQIGSVPYPWLEARGQRRFFGDPTPIQRDYRAEDFRGDWSGLEMAGSVHIQVGTRPGAEIAETAWLDAEAKRAGLPSAIIAFADVTSDNLEEVITDHLSASKLVRGIRHIVSRHPLEDTEVEGLSLLGNSKFVRGLNTLGTHNLSFDLQLSAPLLNRSAEVFGSVPDLPVALCHAGLPWFQGKRGLRDWKKGLVAFSALPCSVCKLSGLGMFNPQWTKDTLAPIVEGVLEAFGPKRIMWGSNFPVDRLYRDYRSLFETIRELIPESAHGPVFGETAIAFYRLSNLAKNGGSTL